MVFLLLGGLGLFLYGINMMSDGLESLAGDRMRRTLEILTNNRFVAVGVGAVVTAAIQSSSATTVMAVGFVNAGLMTLLQATGVIMGANIGTTITAQLIAFKLTDVAPFFLFAGMLMAMFIKRKRLSKLGEIILGFGMLFVGLSLMSQAMEPLRHNEAFLNFLISFKNPVIGILIGAVFTAIVQSSSASIGILQTFAAAGMIGLDSAVFVILGQNIGTCLTAVLAAIGTSANSRRTAGIHLMFNIFGAIFFLIIVTLFPVIVTEIESLSVGNVSRQIANFHTIFNVSVTVLLFPFANYMVRFISRVIPDKPDPHKAEMRLIYLDERITQTPAIALSQTLKEIKRMGQISSGNLKLALESFFELDEAKANKVIEIEKTVDYLSDNIANYLIEFQGLEELSENELKTLGGLHHVIIDMERISDLAENIAEYAISLLSERASLTPEARSELTYMADKAVSMLDTCLEIFNERDIGRLEEIHGLETELDDLEKEFINNHIRRLQYKACDPQVGVIYTNMMSTLERIGDHANNIAYAIQTGTSG
ncbi:MAG: Na/Pi cotransporter family protein [Clostridiales bacterium]|nr:Na/Pi cotransporter family protein [Clostridiales bacterium]